MLFSLDLCINILWIYCIFHIIEFSLIGLLDYLFMINFYQVNRIKLSYAFFLRLLWLVNSMIILNRIWLCNGEKFIPDWIKV